MKRISMFIVCLAVFAVIEAKPQDYHSHTYDNIENIKERSENRSNKGQHIWSHDTNPGYGYPHNHGCINCGNKQGLELPKLQGQIQPQGFNQGQSQPQGFDQKQAQPQGFNPGFGQQQQQQQQQGFNPVPMPEQPQEYPVPSQGYPKQPQSYPEPQYFGQPHIHNHGNQGYPYGHAHGYPPVQPIAPCYTGNCQNIYPQPYGYQPYPYPYPNQYNDNGYRRRKYRKGSDESDSSNESD